jgi:3-deoxy-manno-octulosonate cytidylyltransferase (CMP-KDO synthetase)
MAFTVVIPSRFQSQRLPRKALLDIGGKPMIQRVYEQAVLSDAVLVIVATDDKRIADVVAGFGGEYCMTSTDHPSGTDRIQEVGQLKSMSDDTVIVNVQGDEPLIPPAVINQVASNLEKCDAQIATLCESVESLEDVLDPNIVKVVMDEDNIALYFSRAPIPWDRDNFPDTFQNQTAASLIRYWRHVGIYAYRVSFLNQYVTWSPDVVEQLEKLEQLRALRKGIRIHVAEALEPIPPGVDTNKDLERIRKLI